MADFFEDQNNAQGLGLLGGAVKGFAQGLMQADDLADRREDRKMKRLEFEAKMKSDSEKKLKEQNEKKFEYEGKLRDDYLKNQTTKNSQTIKESFDKINTASANAQGDMGLVFGYMKILDPGSTVREGEYANASNTTGLSGKISQLYNKVLDGQILTPEQRMQFKREAAKIYAAQQKSQIQLDNQFGELADRYKNYGVDRNNVVLKIFENPETGEKQVVPVPANSALAVEGAPKTGLLAKPKGLVKEKPEISQEQKDRARLEELRRKASGG